MYSETIKRRPETAAPSKPYNPLKYYPIRVRGIEIAHLDQDLPNCTQHQAKSSAIFLSQDLLCERSELMGKTRPNEKFLKLRNQPRKTVRQPMKGKIIFTSN